jgi:hypothetical protein
MILLNDGSALRIAAGLLAAVVLVPADGHAYSLLTEGGACPNGIRWASDQNLSINVANAGAQAFAITDAMVDVADRIDQVGGQWFDYDDPYGVESGPYATPGAGDTNGNGINEVGLADLSSLTNVLAMGPTEVDLTNCEITEGDVFLDSNAAWDFGVPDDGRPSDTCKTEDCYFDAAWTHCASGGKIESCPTEVGVYWGRTIILHELGHTLGLAHSDHSYSFMNYEIRPHTNRDDAKRVEFLPDDREALRVLYGNGATEIDAAVTTTWYDPTDVSNSGAAAAKRLCKPSTGVAYSPSIFDDYCGVDAAGNPGETKVCPGDNLYVRYALVNYGTVSLVVNEELWFSRNTWLDTVGGSDVVSPTAKPNRTLNPQSSYRMGRTFEVPSGLLWNKTYYPILFIDGADLATEESQQNNWIPLRARIKIKRQAEC